MELEREANMVGTRRGENNSKPFKGFLDDELHFFDLVLPRVCPVIGQNFPPPKKTTQNFPTVNPKFARLMWEAFARLRC